MNANATREYVYKRDFQFPFERDFDFEGSLDIARSMKPVLLWSIAAYIPFIYFGQILMKNRPKFELRRPLILWNLGLGFFSLLGAVRTVPEFIYVYKELGFHGTVCVPGYPTINKVHSVWTFLFCMSKLPELGDTVFIVLRKQKLIFLHWYHHIATALYCYYTYEAYVSMNRWFVDMNLSVHSIMYTYYAMRAMGFSLPRWYSMLITTVQILQMILGTTVCCYAYWEVQAGRDCGVSSTVAGVSILMYFSYMILFVNFFIQSYFRPGGKAAPSERKLKQK